MENEKFQNESSIVLTWNYKNRNLVIVHRVNNSRDDSRLKDYFCGYCETILKLPFVKIANKIKVHGGLNYGPIKCMTVSFPDSLFYGYSCDQIGDDNHPECRNTDWLKKETESLCDQIIELEKSHKIFCQDEYTPDELLEVFSNRAMKNPDSRQMDPCSICNSKHFNFDSGFIPLFPEHSSTPIGTFKTAAPVLILSCKNCGNIQFFSKAALGVVSKAELKFQS